MDHIEITKIIEWDMGHRVPNHRSQCCNPHGHRYRLEVTVTGQIQQEKGSAEEGMVVDFGVLKQIMMESIHRSLDHAFMVSSDDIPMKAFFENNPQFRWVEVPFIPTAENIVKWCYEQIAPRLPLGLQITRLRLFETPNSWADYFPLHPC